MLTFKASGRSAEAAVQVGVVAAHRATEQFAANLAALGYDVNYIPTAEDPGFRDVVAQDMLMRRYRPDVVVLFGDPDREVNLVRGLGRAVCVVLNPLPSSEPENYGALSRDEQVAFVDHAASLIEAALRDQVIDEAVVR